MIKSGVVSVTFRKKSPRELVDISVKAGLQAIEWGSDVHVRPGDTALAREVRDMTVSAGLDVASYGSYYYLGMDAEDFAPYLETAVNLGAPNIRVWASKVPSKTCDRSFFNHVVEDALKISEEAKKAGITISTEYHANTLTDTNEAALRLLDAVMSDNFYSYWQQPVFVKACDQHPEMKNLLVSGKLSNVHVYTSFEGQYQQSPLADGTEQWRQYLKTLNDGTLRYALLEFVKDGTDESFMADSAVLNSLIAEL